MIKSISIRKLFGLYDYNLTFKHSLGIITGPNGSGKTTILTIIERLYACKLYYFCHLPYQAIKVEFSDGYSLDISVVEEISIPKYDFELYTFSSVQFDLVHDDKVRGTFLISCKQVEQKLKREFKDIGGIGVDKLNDFLDGQIIDSKALSEKKDNTVILYLSSLSINFLSVNRLRANENWRAKKAVSLLSENLKEIIAEAEYNYLRKVQELDATTLQRILDNKNYLSEEEYEKMMMIINEKVAGLHKYDLLQGKSPLKVIPYEKEKSNILGTFLHDTLIKLSFLEPIATKLDLFVALLEKKQFLNKRVRINSRKGLTVVASNGAIIPIEALSSGEQHEIVMLYELLFEMPAGTLLLVDEPEISLHVAWQRMFLDDMLTIINQKDMQLIVATHSPQIIDKYWDQSIDLYSQIEKHADA